MKQYVVDELRLEDIEKIKSYLDDNFESSQIDGIYWIPIDPTLLTEVQSEHSECQPFFFTIDLEEDMMASELLVRTKNKISCNCICYANEEQRNWLIDFIDTIFERLNIII